MEQKRILKVYAKFPKSVNRNIRNPEIRLTGKWLENWGFKCGKEITVMRLNEAMILIREGANSPPTIHL